MSCAVLARTGALGCTQEPLSDLHIGQELEGTIVGLHLLHGCVVDVGIQWDGLVPITAAQWALEPVKQALRLERTVSVRVHQARALAPNQRPRRSRCARV